MPGGRNCALKFRDFVRKLANSGGCRSAHTGRSRIVIRIMLRPKRAGAGVVNRWRPPDWKHPPRCLDLNPTTTFPGPLGKGMISGLCIAQTGLKGKNGRVLDEVGLFLGEGREYVVRGDFLCMVKGVQVYGESLDDTHAMKICDTSFVVPVRQSDSHIWSSANEPEFGRVANAKFIAHLRTTGPA